MRILTGLCVVLASLSLVVLVSCKKKIDSDEDILGTPATTTTNTQLVEKPVEKTYGNGFESRIDEFTKGSKKHTVRWTDRLYQLSQKYYGDPAYWVIIYYKNESVVSFPDLIICDKTLEIPTINKTEMHSKKARALLSELYAGVAAKYDEIGKKKKAESMRVVSRAYTH